MIGSNATIVGDVKIPVSLINRPSKQNNQQRNVGVNFTIGQMDLMGIYRVFHPIITK
jgi:hypothetical protein